MFSSLSRIRKVHLFGLLAALVAVTAVLPASPATAKMKRPISVYPVPKTPVASNMTTFSFRGIKKSQLGPVKVYGQKTGLHKGSLLAHSDGRGVSFVPKEKFARGEFVWVSTKRWIRGATGGQNGRFWVKIGNFYGADDKGKPKPATPAKGNLKSRPDLNIPELHVATPPTAAAAPGKIFMTVRNSGMAMTDRAGRIQWFRPVSFGGFGNQNYNLRAQRYRGKSVLTYWKGASAAIGYSQVGNFEILDRRYKRIARFKPGNGYQPDIHEFVITPQNTALVLAYRGVIWDASKVGGLKNARVLDNVVQEVDIKTGAVIFEWHALGNVSVGASQVAVPRDPKASYDFFHANSVARDGKGAFIVSARKVSSVYRIDRASGRLLWALRGSGKNARSDFKMGPGTRFGYQHDAHRLPNGDISIFDNGSATKFEPDPPANTRSAALTLRLSGNTPKTRKATRIDRWEQSGFPANDDGVIETDKAPVPILSDSQGNAQYLPTGGRFVGWGSRPQMTEFDKDGNVVFDLWWSPMATQSYRAFKMPWSGLPGGVPAIASEKTASPEGIKVWASWNGATKIAKWKVLAGADDASLTEVTTVPWSGLETEISVPGPAPAKVRVVALDRDGKTLSQSKVIAPAEAPAAS